MTPPYKCLISERPEPIIMSGADKFTVFFHLTSRIKLFVNERYRMI
jgi:hypothetical protein